MCYQPNRNGDGIKIRQNALDARRALRNLLGHYADAEFLFNHFPGHGAAFRNKFEIVLGQCETKFVQTGNAGLDAMNDPLMKIDAFVGWEE